jgi:putative ABC transport system permease protein
MSRHRDVAVISHELWQTAFGGAAALGRRIVVDGRSREVIGILPPGTDVNDTRAAIWLPLGLNPATTGFRGYHVLSAIGRIRDGIGPEAAQSEINTLMENWAERVGLPPAAHVFTLTPNSAAGERLPHPLRMRPLKDALLGGVGRLIWILQVAVAVVLLTICANLANLLFARGALRRREFAVRTALGASVGQLLRQPITEGLLLAVGGGVLGMMAGAAAVRVLLMAYADALPRALEVGVDIRVWALSCVVVIATGVLIGVSPLVHTGIRSLTAALKDGRDGSGRTGLRQMLVVAQVALAVTLVAVAVLLARTVYNLATVDAGFERSRLVTFAVSAPDTNVAVGRVQVYERILESLRRLPAVDRVSAMSELPPSQHFYSEDTQIDGYEPVDGGPREVVDYYQSVRLDYFDTMGIPIVQGRGFLPADAAGRGMVAVVNERLANTFWKGRNPIGQRLKPDWGDWVPWFTVVGVARDVRQNGVHRTPGTELYFFVDQMALAPAPLGRTPVTMNVVMRTTRPPETFLSDIQRIVHDVDPAVPVAHVRDMDAVFTQSIHPQRLLAQLLGAFAAITLVLAAIGTYGLLSYIVVSRRREIGVRMALGADRRRLIGHVMSGGLRLAGIGFAIGTLGALAARRVTDSMLFGVRPTDPTTLIAVGGTVLAAAALACCLPAWRATRVDPNIVLRAD